MYINMRMSDPLEQELKTVESYNVGARNRTQSSGIAKSSLPAPHLVFDFVFLWFFLVVVVLFCFYQNLYGTLT